jgi:hypothetical protein
MVEALTPLALASPANSCFQASKPPGPLPHWAASAVVLKHTSTARLVKTTAANFLLPIIPKLPFTPSPANTAF